MPNSIFPAVVAILLRQNMGLRGPLLPFASLQKKLQSRSRETAFSRSGILLELGGNLLGPFGKAPHPPTQPARKQSRKGEENRGNQRIQALVPWSNSPNLLFKKIFSGKGLSAQFNWTQFPRKSRQKIKSATRISKTCLLLLSRGHIIKGASPLKGTIFICRKI